YSASCSGITAFGHTFTIPIEFESPDELLHFDVFHEPEYDDSEPVLLGSISVPLFGFGRGRRTSLRLPLKQDTATRRGFVNVSFGHLTIAAFLEQPLGHLVLPVVGGEATKAGEQDLEKQIARISDLINLIFGRWQMNLLYVVQWEQFWLSLAWLLFMQFWILFAYQWSLAIIVAMLLK
ncbi:unnamed protein product, partial [Polarella glacialis]